MGLLGDELSLGSTPVKASKMMNVAAEKRCKLEEYIKKFEEEKRKIENYELKLPLCLQILNDAILYMKEESKRFTEMDSQPLLKDFMLVNKPNGEEEDDNDYISSQRFLDMKIKNKLEIKRSKDDSSNELSKLLIPKVETGLRLSLTSSSTVNGGTTEITSYSFTSNSTPPPPPPPPFFQRQALRKQRRCWTPELHRRFVETLQNLGGPGVATPKQIREKMQEKSLTNDEVKSHLQKYRLHLRKPNSNLEKELGFKSSEDKGRESSSSPQGPLQLDSESESFQMEILKSP